MGILVTGRSGFVGHYVEKRFPNTIPLRDEAGAIDLREFERLRDYVSKVNPEKVIHLAAQAFVPRSFEEPKETFEINLMGTLNLLMALEAINFQGRFLYVGSGDIYGVVPEKELPIVENRLLAPRSPYAVSKMAAEGLCYQWSQTADFEIVMARPFNHIGAGQDSRFVVSSFAKQIAEIKLGLREPVIHVGNLHVTRDFTDVRDVVEAFALLLEKGGNGEVYNICSGKEYELKEVFTLLLDIASVEALVKVDAERLRKNEHCRVCGSFEKIYRMTGWTAKNSLKESLTALYQYWEKAIDEEKSINYRDNRAGRGLSSGAAAT